MSWHLLEKLLEEVSKQSTFVGKLWIMFLFVFRIIAITRFGDFLYADEQVAFRQVFHFRLDTLPMQLD